MPEKTVAAIKAALMKNKAPVQIIYNHYGYWHANLIVGFNDNGDNDDCRFVRDFLTYIKNVSEITYESSTAAFENGGGCCHRWCDFMCVIFDLSRLDWTHWPEQI